MLRNKRGFKGFTLIELMVVIVIIGVLASLAIPRFTEASAKAKIAEAPRVVASFESAYLALVAELGEITTTENLIFENPGTTKWFEYTDPTVTGEFSAVAVATMGKNVAKNDALVTNYSADDGDFKHTVNGASVCKAVPNFCP